MQYDFDEQIPRRGTNSYKWDTLPSDSDIPMWVADMDFRTAPAIIEALRRRVEHGIFGYTKVPDSYYDALVSWFARRHGWDIDRNDVIYTSGVVPALSAIIKALTKPGDKVIVQTPAYNCFFSSIRNNKCSLLPNNLLVDDGGRYVIDFDDLERKASDPDASLMIICNPHNPVGRLWRKEELLRVAEICKRHNVVAVSDEIHCELTYHEPYTPFANVAKEIEMPSIVCVSPSKAFNIAGLQIANIIATDNATRAKIDRAINDNEVCDVNPFGVVGLTAAYDRGEEWLEALLRYLWDNYLAAKDYFEKEMPQYKVTPLEATYLLWVDISASQIPSDKFADMLMDKEGLMVSPGTIYGEGGVSHIRLNIACPRSTMLEGLHRLNKFTKRLPAVP